MPALNSSAWSNDGTQAGQHHGAGPVIGLGASHAGNSWCLSASCWREQTVQCLKSAHCHAGTETANKLGKFLVQAQFQGSVHSSAMFLTAAAQNLLCLKLASEMGVAISNPWVTWLKGAIGPALVGLLITPLIIFKVSSWQLIPLPAQFKPPHMF